MAAATVTALEIVGGSWACVHADGVRTYTYLASVVPKTVVDGNEVDFPPDLRRALDSEGFNGQIEVTVPHVDGPGGAGPTATGIGTEQLQAIGAAHAALCAAWIDKTVTIVVE